MHGRPRQGHRHRQVLRHLLQRPRRLQRHHRTGRAINPATGKPYGPTSRSSPSRTWSNAQKRLLDHLGIERLLAVVGGSMGGMQALEWAVSLPRARARSACRSPRRAPARRPGDRLRRGRPPGHHRRPELRERRHYYGGAAARPRPADRAHDRPHHLPVRRVDAREVRPAAAGHADDYTYDFVSRVRGRELPAPPGAQLRRALRRQHLPVHHARRWTTSTSRASTGSLAEAFADVQARFLVHRLLQRLAAPHRTSSRRSSRRCARRTSDVTYAEIELPTGTTPSCSSPRRWRASSPRSWRAAPGPTRRPLRPADGAEESRHAPHRLQADRRPRARRIDACSTSAAATASCSASSSPRSGVHGSGVEIDQAAVEKCIGRGLSVFHGDLDDGLADFDDLSFDVVILPQTCRWCAGRGWSSARCCAWAGSRSSGSPTSRTGSRARSCAARAHARLARSAVPVVRHAQHPSLDHQGLPRAVPGGGSLHRARAVPAVGGEGPAGAIVAPNLLARIAIFAVTRR